MIGKGLWVMGFFPLLFLPLRKGNGEAVNLIELPSESKADLHQMPKNLARWHMGASLYLVGKKGRLTLVNRENMRNFPASVLLGDDETLGYELEPGEHSFIVDLGDFYNINRAFFLSYSAGGSVAVSASETMQPIRNRRWIKVLPDTDFQPDRPASYTFPILEARYLHFHFRIEKKGEIASLGVFGNTTISETEYEREKGESESEGTGGKATTSFDYASLYTGSEITHLNSGDLVSADKMIDDDVNTYYEFSGGDRESILVLDLKDFTSVNAVSLLFEANPGVIEFYILRSLGEILRQGSSLSGEEALTKEDLRSVGKGGAMVSVPDEFFNKMVPVYTKEVVASGKRIRLRYRFGKREGRYLLLRWVANKAT